MASAFRGLSPSWGLGKRRSGEKRGLDTLPVVQMQGKGEVPARTDRTLEQGHLSSYLVLTWGQAVWAATPGSQGMARGQGCGPQDHPVAQLCKCSGKSRNKCSPVVSLK